MIAATKFRSRAATSRVPAAFPAAPKAGIAKVYGRHSLAVVLTGMGEDGVEGRQAIVEAGGAVIAQDEDTSVIWGMPGAVAAAGLCRAVLPAKEIAPFMREYATRS